MKFDDVIPMAIAVALGVIASQLVGRRMMTGGFGGARPPYSTSVPPAGAN